jgi:hypothetical protein
MSAELAKYMFQRLAADAGLELTPDGVKVSDGLS